MIENSGQGAHESVGIMQGVAQKLRYAGGILVLSAALPFLSAESDSTHRPEAKECLEELEAASPGPWAELGRTICRSLPDIETFGHPNFTRVPLAELDPPPESIEAIDDVMDVVRPFANRKNYEPDTDSVEVTKHDWEFPSLFTGTLDNGRVRILVTPAGRDRHEDPAVGLKTLFVHEIGHHIVPDETYDEEWQQFSEIAGQSSYIEAALVDTTSAERCNEIYTSSLWGLFDESSYEDGPCADGSPDHDSDEGLISTLVITHLFPDEFIDNFQQLDEEERVVATRFLGAAIQQLQRINPDQSAIDAFISPEVQRLVA